MLYIVDMKSKKNLGAHPVVLNLRKIMNDKGITQSVMASKNLISQSIGRTIPVVEAYRTLSNKNKEVLVRIAYNSEMAKEAAKDIVRKDLEQRVDKLHGDLDRLLGW